MPRPSRSVAFLGSAALAVVAVVATLALLEGALRLLGGGTVSIHPIAAFTVYDPQLGWRLAPSRETVFRAGSFAVPVVQNAEGLRDRHYPYERAPGRRRILVLGDSVVWGWGVPQDSCFTERLEATLTDTDVINTGVPGWSTAQEVFFYEREGRRYGSDLVLLVVVPNDFRENLDDRGPRFRLENGLLALSDLPVRRRRNRAGEWLQAHSRLFARAAYAVSVLGDSLRRKRPPKQPADTAPVAVAPLAVGPSPAAAQADAPPVQPYGQRLPPPGSRAWALEEALIDRLAGDVQRDGARLVVALDLMPPVMEQFLHRVCAARGIPLVDFAPVFSAVEAHGVRTHLDGDPHPSAAGHAAVAAALREFLEREGLVPGAVR